MAGLSVEYINPFLAAATTILKQTCMIEAAIGKPGLKDMKVSHDSLIIIIGITGDVRGQVIIEFNNAVACDIAGKMMMQGPLPELGEIGFSAICELGNMVLGNAATLFSSQGIGIDITPPTVGMGDMSFSASFTKNLCIPLTYDGDKCINMNIAITSD